MRQVSQFQLQVFVECKAMVYDFQESLANNLSQVTAQHIQEKETVDTVGLVRASEHMNLGLEWL